MKDDQSHLKHALNRSNFSHSKNRVSTDCQSSLVTLAFSYIKLQVWVLIEYNTWIATGITVLVTHHQHALKGSNFSHSKNRVSRDCQRCLSSDIILFLHQVTSVGPYRIQYL